MRLICRCDLFRRFITILIARRNCFLPRIGAFNYEFAQELQGSITERSAGDESKWFCVTYVCGFGDLISDLLVYGKM